MRIDMERDLTAECNFSSEDYKGAVKQPTKDVLEMLGYRNVASLGGIEIEPMKSVMSGKTKLKGLEVCHCKSS